MMTHILLLLISDLDLHYFIPSFIPCSHSSLSLSPFLGTIFFSGLFFSFSFGPGLPSSLPMFYA